MSETSPFASSSTTSPSGKGAHQRVRRKSQSTRQPAGSGIGHEHASEGNDAAAKERRKVELALAVLMKAKCWKGHSAQRVGTCSQCE